MIGAVSCRSGGDRVRYPQRIAILPVYNETIDIDAPHLFYAILTRELAQKDYYIVPPTIALEMLSEEKNVREAGQMNAYSIREIGDLLHADAILLVTLTDWSAKYLAVLSTVTVSARFRLVDVKSGALLWETTATRAKGSGARTDGLLAAAASALSNAIFTQYVTLAEEVIDTAFSRLPDGPFRPLEGGDFAFDTPPND
jgi:hypothetical protein